MFQNPIMEGKIFDLLGIDLMDPFPSFYGNKYVLVTVDYVFKWWKQSHSLQMRASTYSDFYRRISLKGSGVLEPPSAMAGHTSTASCSPT